MCGSSTAEYGYETYRYRILIRVKCNRREMDSMPRSDLLKTIERYQSSIQLVNPVENDPQRVSTINSYFEVGKNYITSVSTLVRRTNRHI